MGMPQILTKEISLWEDPGTKEDSLLATKEEILKVLKKVLSENQCSILNLVLHMRGRGSTGPFVDKIFILGRRKAILCNLQKIVKRIAAGKRFNKNGTWIEGVWIGFDPSRGPKIEDFV